MFKCVSFLSSNSQEDRSAGEQFRNEALAATITKYQRRARCAFYGYVKIMKCSTNHSLA